MPIGHAQILRMQSVLDRCMPIEWLLDNTGLLKDSVHKWLSGFHGSIQTSEFTPERASLLGGLAMPVLQPRPHPDLNVRGYP